MNLLKLSHYFLLLICSSTVFSQTTILNVPSTDIAGEKRLTVEADFIAHLDKWETGGFQTYGIRAIYGAGKKIETGLNIYYTRNGLNSPKELQTNFKYRFFANEKYGIAATIGSQLVIPVNRSAGNRVFGMIYANASKIVKQTYSTRLTGGFYTIAGAEKGFGSKNGALLAVEQPIKGRLSFYADWYSGKNRFGYSAAGLNFTLTKKQYILIGYNFGNYGRGNNSLGIYYGHTF